MVAASVAARKFPELPRWWDIPYASHTDCWGCGLEPIGEFCDLHYGPHPRPLCTYCWALVSVTLHKLPRPPRTVNGEAVPTSRIRLRVVPATAPLLPTPLVRQQMIAQ